MAPQQKAYLGTGRRKTSVARVRVTEGNGQITINDRELENFFNEEKDRGAVVGPLVVTDLRSRVNVKIKVHGGGVSGQAGACSQGLARAIKSMFGEDPVAPEPAEGAEGATPTEGVGFAKRLRDSGYLTRDSRMKERKKYGKKGARKSFQFSKR